jgi:hypothetical protein
VFIYKKNQDTKTNKSVVPEFNFSFISIVFIGTKVIRDELLSLLSSSRDELLLLFSLKIFFNECEEVFDVIWLFSWLVPFNELIALRKAWFLEISLFSFLAGFNLDSFSCGLSFLVSCLVFNLSMLLSTIMDVCWRDFNSWVFEVSVSAFLKNYNIKI